MNRTQRVALVFAVLIMNGNCLFNRESPILWRESPVPVIREVIEIEQDILYLSPCDLINNATVDPHNVESLRDWCTRLFEADFVTPLKTFCSPVNMDSPDRVLAVRRNNTLVRSKRVPFLLPLALPFA